MSPRTGRPIKNSTKRDKSLTIRLTGDEVNRIQKCADKLGTSRTDAIMHGISLVEKEK